MIPPLELMETMRKIRFIFTLHTLNSYLGRCSTCYLNTFNCPGHVGHIELPVPVYHPIFMSQLVGLLRAKCAYCRHLRLPPAEVNRITCKLRLVEHGLMAEVQELENISSSSKREAAAPDGEYSGEEEEGKDVEDLMKRRVKFVKQAIKRNLVSEGSSSRDRAKVEAISETRRAIIKEFVAASTGTKTCGTCGG